MTQSMIDGSFISGEKKNLRAHGKTRDHACLISFVFVSGLALRHQTASLNPTVDFDINSDHDWREPHAPAPHVGHSEIGG